MAAFISPVEVSLSKPNFTSSRRAMYSASGTRTYSLVWKSRSPSLIFNSSLSGRIQLLGRFLARSARLHGKGLSILEPGYCAHYHLCVLRASYLASDTQAKCELWSEI